MKRLVILLIFLIWFSFSSGKEINIYVVVGKETDIKVSCEDIKHIYLKEIIFINGIKMIPVNLPANSTIRKYFRKYVLGMDEEEISLYWNEKYYEGITPPLVLKSQKAVKEFLKKVKGSIGYITKKYLDKDLKILCVIRLNHGKNFNNR